MTGLDYFTPAFLSCVLLRQTSQSLIHRKRFGFSRWGKVVWKQTHKNESTM